MTAPATPTRLSKELGLFDVYAISTGAMFSSGFFLLPGLAAAQTGPSVAFAYLVSGLFIVPAMFSVAELATAMPRAGGAYYFLDRAFGPLVGTVGGLGTWMALVLKSAFALVGMGAYLAIYVDIPIAPVAVGLTLAFMTINIVGAKETGALQRVLVVTLLAVLGFFIVQGLFEVFGQGLAELTRERFTPFFTSGVGGVMGTVGFVFVSYAGLTKVASVAEEVRNPDRNIPLGMGLSLATAAAVYTVGVYIIVAVLPPAELRDDITPVATAAQAFFDWLPAGLGVLLIVISATAAFASTGNAGILSASRYPLAMARDRLVPSRFGRLGRFGTPTFAIVTTSLLMSAAILLLDLVSIAKLASAFQLLLFSLLSLAVVIMRESQIEGYDPGYRSPLYPWMQIVGFVTPFWLIAEMGEMAVLFSLGLIAVTLGWYFHYGRPRAERAGAILHTFARLGARRYHGLDLELRSIVQEKGLRQEDPFDEVIARGPVIDVSTPTSLDQLARDAADALRRRGGLPQLALERDFRDAARTAYLEVAPGVVLAHVRIADIDRPRILLVRCHSGVLSTGSDWDPLPGQFGDVRALFFLVSPEDAPGPHLRLLGHLARVVGEPDFLDDWMAADGETELKEALLRADRWVSLRVGQQGTEHWAGREVRDLDLPAGVLIALIRRQGQDLIPHGTTVLQPEDRLTVIGEPAALAEILPAAGTGDGAQGADTIAGEAE